MPVMTILAHHGANKFLLNSTGQQYVYRPILSTTVVQLQQSRS